MLAAYIDDFGVCAAEGAWRLLEGKVMKIQEFAERQRQHFDLYTTARENGGVFRREQEGV